MVEKKKRKAPRERTERRFIPVKTRSSLGAAAVGMTGSAVLGAGVYAQWVTEAPPAFAPALVTAGAIGLGAGLWLGSASMFPVRVGDAGVAIERGAEITRVLWCDVEELRVQGSSLVIKSKGLSLEIPVAAHPKATPYIVAEADRRVPSIVKLDDAARRGLPALVQGAGEVVAVTGDQVAGRRCAATQKIISFERDARLCPNCGQVYFKDNVPQTCVTCGQEVAGRAVQA